MAFAAWRHGLPFLCHARLCDDVSVPTASSISTDLQESSRLRSLHAAGILDTLPEQHYEDIAELASFICGTPISLVSFVGDDRQWFKAERGLGVRETPRSQSFCAHTIDTGSTLVVEDASSDPRFTGNPLVTGNPNIRFYAGAPSSTIRARCLAQSVLSTQSRALSNPGRQPPLRHLRGRSRRWWSNDALPPCPRRSLSAFQKPARSWSSLKRS